MNVQQTRLQDDEAPSRIANQRRMPLIRNARIASDDPDRHGLAAVFPLRPRCPSFLRGIDPSDSPGDSAHPAEGP